MNARDFYQANKRNPKLIDELCKKAGTNSSNFRQIAMYNGPVSKDLAQRLAHASNGKMTAAEIMFPEQS